MTLLARVAAPFAVCLLAASPAAAQEVSDGWRFSLTPYLWLAGYEGDASGFPTGHPSDVTVDFGDVMDNISGAFIGKGEIQYQRFGVIADVLYLKLSGDRTFDPANLPGLGTEVEIALTTSTLAAFYRVHETDRLNVDLLAGARFSKAKLEVDLALENRPGISRDVSQTWTDPIVGVRAKQRIGERSSLTGYADYGGGDESTVWQVYGAYDYAWTEKASVFVGYRHLSQDLKRNQLSYEITLSGPLVGLTYTF